MYSSFARLFCFGLSACLLFFLFCFLYLFLYLFGFFFVLFFLFTLSVRQLSMAK